jgi:osmoprotectant transport system substrate-binding protein
MRTRLPRLVAALALAAGVLAACSSGGGAKGTPITVASFGFSESEVLAQVYGQALQHAGAKVTYKLKLGNREVVAPALEKGDIDLVPEYLGNYLGYLDPKQTSGMPADQALTALQAAAKAKGLTVTKASSAADGDVLAVTKDFAQKNGLTTISDLKKVAGTLALAGPSECETRQTCLLGLRSTYGLTVTFLSTGQDAGGPITKAALNDNKAQVARLFSSDTDVAAGGKYVVLQDDKSFQQAGNVVPVIRTSKATAKVVEVLDKVSAALTTEELIALNKQTDVDKLDPADVAAAFVKAKGL